MRNYLIALCEGEREPTYGNYQIIEAKNCVDAVEKYNEINDCSYYYGEALAAVVDVEKVERFLKKLTPKKLLDLSFDGSLEQI